MSEHQTNIQHEVPDSFIQAEINRSTQPLEDTLERGGMGAEGRRLLGERVLQVSQLVQESPDRLAVDQSKSPDKRTEYDAERAHMAALAVDKEMSFIADDKRKHAGEHYKWSGKRQRAELSQRQWTSVANEVYDKDPLESGPNTIEHLRMRAQSPRQRRRFTPLDHRR